MVEYVSIGLVCSVLGVLISYAVFMRNKTKEDKNEGRQDGVMLTELGYIKANTDEIKNEQREQRRINTEVFSRLSAVESSAKQAHHRLDHLEGQITPHTRGE